MKLLDYFIVGPVDRLPAPVQTLSGIPDKKWREYDPEDTLR
jgi:hypothetical protein